jgi:tryptophan synthase alpha chain
MSRIASCFSELKTKGRKAYVGYVMSGFPDPAAALSLGGKLLESGADLLEIGIPFSDPIADGPVITRAAEAALKGASKTADALELVARLRSKSQAPLLLMSYLNPILAMGYAAFAKEAAKAGADGLVVPDLIPEESKELKAELGKNGLDLIFLAAPTSTPARLKKIATASSGFIYVVSVAGVTGERSSFDSRLDACIAGLRKQTQIPLCVGFGVSSPESAKQAASKADGVVVASTVLKVLQEGGSVDQAVMKAAALVEAAHGA